MIVELKYKSIKYGKKQKTFWKSLVRCDCEFHVGNRDRVVGYNNIKNGIGINSCNKCAVIIKNKSNYMRKKVSLSKMGNKNINWGKKMSLETRIKISNANKGKKRTIETRKRMSIAFRGHNHTPKGDKNPNWNPNLTEKERQARTSDKKNLVWAINVKTRDNFTCQITNQRGGSLISHHLNSYHSFINNRYDLNNGITLSKEIHNIFHLIYGMKNNTAQQFKEFKSYIIETLE